VPKTNSNFYRRFSDNTLGSLQWKFNRQHLNLLNRQRRFCIMLIHSVHTQKINTQKPKKNRKKHR